jgi:MFS family permease
VIGAVERDRSIVLPTDMGFWLAASVFLLVFAISAAPTPLYGVYQDKWGFSAITLTSVFAIYAVFLLAGLLLFGSISDHLGRRRMISIALVANATVCALFLTANGVGMLYVARALQGLAVGVATSSLGAALIDLQPEGSGLAPVLTSVSPLWGLAIGALGTSALVEYAPAPTHLIWYLLLGASLIGSVGILAIPETSPGHPNVLASLRPSIGIPSHARSTFAETAPIMIAAWAMNGFYLSLGPSLASQVLDSKNLMWGGLVIFLVTASGGFAAVFFRSVDARPTMIAGCFALLAGTAMTFGAVAVTSAPAFLLGTGIAGVGFGLSFLGSFRVLSALAAPHERAKLVSAVFIEAYAAFSVPVVIAGIGTAHFGLHRTALVYSATLAVLVATALLILLFKGRPDSSGPVEFIPRISRGRRHSAQSVSIHAQL